MNLILRRGVMVSLLVSTAARGWAQSADGIEVRLRADEEVHRTIPAALLANLTVERDTSSEATAMAAAVPPSRGIPVIFIISGVLALPVLAQSVIELARQYYYGGVIIDTRDKPVSITNSRAVPARMVFVIDGQGKIQQFKGDDMSADLLAKLLPGK